MNLGLWGRNVFLLVGCVPQSTLILDTEGPNRSFTFLSMIKVDRLLMNVCFSLSGLCYFSGKIMINHESLNLSLLNFLQGTVNCL